MNSNNEQNMSRRTSAYGGTKALVVLAGLAFAEVVSSCERAGVGPGDAEVDACIHTMESAATSDAPAAERAAKAASGCARIYAEPECQQAHERFGEGDPSQKARLLAEQCAHAYCGKLPE